MVPRARPFPVTHPPIADHHAHDVRLSIIRDAHGRGTPVHSRMASAHSQLRGLLLAAAAAAAPCASPSRRRHAKLASPRTRAGRADRVLFAHRKRDEPHVPEDGRQGVLELYAAKANLPEPARWKLSQLCDLHGAHLDDYVIAAGW
jgi:hypothetical protein